MKKLFSQKVNIRKKTRKQKEKNKRQKKKSISVQKRKINLDKVDTSKSFMNRVRKLYKDKFERVRSIKDLGFKKISNWFNPQGQSRTRSIKIRKPSMRAPKGFMSRSYSSRMPLGSRNHLIMNERIAQPYEWAEAESTRALRAVPEESLPRGHRRAYLKEAHAKPMNSHGYAFAHTYEHDPGQTAEIVADLRPYLTRPMTQLERIKEDNWARRNAERSTGER